MEKKYFGDKRMFHLKMIFLIILSSSLNINI